MRTRNSLGMFALLLALLSASFALAAPAEVVDQAGFFRRDTIDNANQQLAQIRTELGRDLRVETHPTIPQDLRAQFDPDHKPEFFTQWAYQRAKAATTKDCCRGSTGSAGRSPPMAHRRLPHPRPPVTPLALNPPAPLPHPHARLLARASPSAGCCSGSC